MATEAHEKRQEQYDKLMEDSSKWGEQLDPSSQAYGMWKSFQDEITQAADSLSSQGLTINNRKALSNVRKSYGEKIKAIEEADKRMQAQAALRQQMQAKDNSIEYKNNLNIDDFLHGKSGSNELDKEIGNHLHLELYVNGQVVDPMLYLDKELSKPKE